MTIHLYIAFAEIRWTRKVVFTNVSPWSRLSFYEFFQEMFSDGEIAESFSVSFPLIWCFYAKKCFHYVVVLFKENLNAFLEIQQVDIELLLYFNEECIGQVFEKGIVKHQQ